MPVAGPLSPIDLTISEPKLSIPFYVALFDALGLPFHAESHEQVDGVYRARQAIGAAFLDPPTDYSGQRGCGPAYYAVFFADPDGLKLEVVHQPGTNP